MKKLLSKEREGEAKHAGTPWDHQLPLNNEK